ncbi:putative multi antimicrobial extrusion protein [Medicago truncatula]|uniref:Protein DETOXIFICATION n=1 Tax=Medicago truncatula TaxID=3880 RepID=A0A072ULE3_MEDTR|nr:protein DETOXIFICATION 16 [Medicago truncatula]KEH26665.1 MATE efflux family protein [Medicago truncatula]RHN52207.1 putative multi antimicrobial extrusion protein [Medicago truncatula]
MSLHSPLIVEETKQKNKKEEERRELVEEVKKQLWLSGPLISVAFLNFGINLISVMFVGHLGELPLSGASMATSFAAVTGFTLLQGMASALDTLCGQSYGAKQYRMLGVHMQRAMFILMIVAIPLAVIWANTKSILILLGQDPEISIEAGNYARLMVPSLFAYGLLQCLNRFLQAQNIVFPMMLSSVVTTLFHLPVCWFMVYKSGLGSGGAAIANSISYWLNVTILILYVKFSPLCKKTWNGFSKEALALTNIPIFMKLAIPSAIMVCLELWSFELMVLLSGLLPNPKLETSVLSICMNTAGAIWMIPLGLSGATSIRVSNELGAGHPRAVRLAVNVVVVIAIIEGILVGAVIILIRNILGYAYSNEEEVVKYVATMLPIIAVSNFLDGLQCVLSGTVRGVGRQNIGAYVNLGSYYLVGTPAAVVLAFVLHIGGKGLYLGFICALIVQVFSLTIITVRTDWEKEAKKATDRVYDSITTESLVS